MSKTLFERMSDAQQARPRACDTDDYRGAFYGILNADGNFWTPLIFESEDGASKHISHFWRNDAENREYCLKHFKIVPVRAVITLASAIEAATADKTGTGLAEGESATLEEGDAQ